MKVDLERRAQAKLNKKTLKQKKSSQGLERKSSSTAEVTRKKASRDGAGHATRVGSAEHVWETAGSLGLTLKQRGADRASPDGVQVKEVTNTDVPAHLAEMVLKSVAGEDVSTCSYDAVVQKVKAAGRPLKLTFSFESPAVLPPVPIAAAGESAGTLVKSNPEGLIAEDFDIFETPPEKSMEDKAKIESDIDRLVGMVAGAR